MAQLAAGCAAPHGDIVTTLGFNGLRWVSLCAHYECRTRGGPAFHVRRTLVRLQGGGGPPLTLGSRRTERGLDPATPIVENLVRDRCGRKRPLLDLIFRTTNGVRFTIELGQGGQME